MATDHRLDGWVFERDSCAHTRDRTEPAIATTVPAQWDLVAAELLRHSERRAYIIHTLITVLLLGTGAVPWAPVVL